MSRQPRKRLGELLVEAGVVNKKDLETVLRTKSRDQRLGAVLVEREVCSELDIAEALSTQLALDRYDLKVVPITPEAIARVPEKLARKYSVIPLSIENKTSICVAMADPLNLEAVDDIQFASGLMISAVVATTSDVLWAIDQHYKLSASIDKITSKLDDDALSESNVNKITETDNSTGDNAENKNAPVVRMVNHILLKAVESKVSDIHLEPSRANFIVRYRQDGYLRQHLELPKWIQGAVTSRLKVMSKMDIAEKRVPQDGRIGLKVDGRDLDLRVSSLPTKYGEKIVIRILDATGTVIDIDKIGLVDRNLATFKSIISRPQGILLVTGPTGSGKSTTLYAGLSYIKDVTRNITTIEDPIEYELEGINQVGINERAGCTFTSILTSLLRQDPDVIMVGEMRDLDTATIAMQAALTGHLVLSTIHTNNTVATITRLRNLGLASFLIASTINGIIAQRLLRCICPNCKVEDKPDEEKLSHIGITGKIAGEMKFYKGIGCDKCGDTGYIGRTGIYEMLVLSPRMREQISKDANETMLKQLAVAEGMTTLAHAGIEKIASGITSVDELIRVTQMDDDTGSLCSDCGHIIGAGFVACPGCGHRLLKSCGACNQVVDPEWTFCPYCAATIPVPDIQSIRAV